MKKTILEKIDTIVLAGGLGTRIRPAIGDRPKVLAGFGDGTFLDILLGRLRVFGLDSFILAVGHLKNEVKNYIKENYGSCDVEIRFSEENRPLGTGGALKLALEQVRSDNFLVVNGDTVCDIDFQDFYDRHLKSNFPVSIALANSDRSDGGRVVLGEGSEIVSFNEKPGAVDYGYINSGTYFMNKEVVSHMPSADNFSIEYDLFPKLVAKGVCGGFPIAKNVIDIGTPERYNEAIKKLI